MEGETDFGGVIGLRFFYSFFSQDTSRFNELGIVEENKSLLRRAGGAAFDGAEFPRWSVKGGHVRHGSGPLTNCVKAAAIEIGAHALMISGTHGVAFAPKVAGEVRADGGST